MPQVTLSTYRAALFVATTLFAACSVPGASSAPVIGGTKSALSKGSPYNVLYVANLPVTNHGTGDVAEFDPATGKMIATITDGIGADPEALAIDASGNLYVANRVGNNVQVYAPGRTSPTRSLSEGVKAPDLLLFDSLGNLYVGGRKSVVIYAEGQSVPSTIVTGHISDSRAIELDAAGNLYVANWKNNQSYITVYSGATHSLVRTISDGLGFVSTWKVGMAFSRSGDLYVTNPLHNTVTVYRGGSSTLWRTISTGVVFPSSLAFDNSNDYLVGNTPTNEGTINEYAARGNTPRLTITQDVDFPVQFLVSNIDKTIYCDNQESNAVIVFSSATGKVKRVIASGLNKPTSIALARSYGDRDASGDAFEATPLADRGGDAEQNRKFAGRTFTVNGNK